MSRKIHITIILSLMCFLALPSSLQAQIADRDMIAYTPSGRQQVGLYWKDDQGNVLGSLARLKAYTDQKRQRLVFAMNGGMYMEDRAPLGLFIQEGKLIRKLNTASGY